jgi:hypothetical protein
MQRHELSFVVDATPAEVWSVWWPPAPKLGPGEIEVKEFGPVRIEILHQGDEHHDGLVRHCYYRVPKFLLSGGVAESWELVTDVVPNVSSRYRAVTRPPFAMAEGTQRLDDLGDGRTRVTVTETYTMANRLLRPVLERYLHRFISRDNDRLVRTGIEMGLAHLRSARRSGSG